jgi:putative phosphoesterase
MTKILLLSDTHGHIDQAILKHVKAADEVWHAGDIGTMEVADSIAMLKPLRAVYGNIDNHQIRATYPLHNRFNCEQISVWITHIAGYPGRYNRDVIGELKSNPPDLFICGHSHILKVMRDSRFGLLHMNPGAIGKQGFHKVRTMLSFVIDGSEIGDLKVIEYPR